MCYVKRVVEFVLIMGIGMVIAIIIVANLPKSGNIPYEAEKDPFAHKEPPSTPAWRKDISETYPMGDLDYLAKLERHMKDPQHWPCPLPPDAPKRVKSECE